MKSAEQKTKSFLPHRGFDWDCWMNVFGKIGDMRVAISNSDLDLAGKNKLRKPLEEIITALNQSELV